MKEQEILMCSKNLSENILDFSIQQIKCYDFIVEYLQPLNEVELDWMEIEGRELEEMFEFNKYRELPIKIDLSRIERQRKSNKEKAIEEVMKLCDAKIKIKGSEKTTWSETEFYLIHRTYFDHSGGFWVCLSPFAIRWVMDFSKKLGYLSYHSPSLRSLSSAYSAKLYLLMSQWYSKRKFSMSLIKFQEIIGCPTYNSTDMERKILRRAIREFTDKETILQLRYSFSSNDKKKGVGKRRNNIVNIEIFDIRDEKERNKFIELWNQVQQ